MTSFTSRLLLLSCLLLPAVDGSNIMFNSSSSYVKPLVSSNLTITCKIQDTAPVGPAIGKRSVPRDHGNIHGAEGEMKREDLPSDDVTRPTDLSDLDHRKLTKKSVTHTDDNIRFVTSILISRNGEDVASISEHFGVRQLVPDVTVSGHLTTGQGERGVLQVTWPHPTQTEAAVYKCDVDTLTAQAHSLVFSQTINIAEAEVSLNDLVHEFHQLKLEKEKMEKTIHQMNITLADQDKTIGDLNKRISDQAKTIISLQNDNTAMNKTNADQEKAISELKNEKDAMNKAIQNLSLTDQALLQSVNQMKSDLSSFNQSLSSLGQATGMLPKVLFSAFLTSDTILSQNQVLVFNKIITSEGQGYDDHTGVFTAPVSGFYMFNLHVLSDSTNTFHLSLLHNGSKVIGVNKHGDENFGTASNSVLVRLDKGDQVKVSCWTGYTSHVDGDAGWKSTTFSGRLVALL